MALKQVKPENNSMEEKLLKPDDDFVTVNAIVDCGQPEQCTNSNESQLIVDGQFDETNEDNTKVYIQQPMMPCENSNTSMGMSANSSNDGEWCSCNMCGKSFNEKLEFQIHYEQHFNKCTLCLAVFTNRDALNAHRKEMHGSSGEEEKVN